MNVKIQISKEFTFSAIFQPVARVGVQKDVVKHKLLRVKDFFHFSLFLNSFFKPSISFVDTRYFVIWEIIANFITYLNVKPVIISQTN